MLSGEAYGFTIGDSRDQALAVIREKYRGEDHHLRILWPISAEYADVLRPYENTPWKEYSAKEYAEYKIEVSRIEGMVPPLIYSDRWDIDMPATWVNTIYLTFEGEALIEIQKSRWLFERP